MEIHEHTPINVLICTPEFYSCSKCGCEHKCSLSTELHNPPKKCISGKKKLRKQYVKYGLREYDHDMGYWKPCEEQEQQFKYRYICVAKRCLGHCVIGSDSPVRPRTCILGLVEDKNYHSKWVNY